MLNWLRNLLPWRNSHNNGHQSAGASVPPGATHIAAPPAVYNFPFPPHIGFQNAFPVSQSGSTQTAVPLASTTGFGSTVWPGYFPFQPPGISIIKLFFLI